MERTRPFPCPPAPLDAGRPICALRPANQTNRAGVGSAPQTHLQQAPQPVVRPEEHEVLVPRRLAKPDVLYDQARQVVRLFARLGVAFVCPLVVSQT